MVGVWVLVRRRQEVEEDVASQLVRQRLETHADNDDKIKIAGRNTTMNSRTGQNLPLCSHINF